MKSGEVIYRCRRCGAIESRESEDCETELYERSPGNPAFKGIILHHCTETERGIAIVVGYDVLESEN